MPIPLTHLGAIELRDLNARGEATSLETIEQLIEASANGLHDFKPALVVAVQVPVPARSS